MSAGFNDNVPDEIKHAALQLLRDPAFSTVIRQLEKICWETFVSSSPDDPRTRELAYHQFAAVQNIITLLASWSGTPIEGRPT